MNARTGWFWTDSVRHGRCRGRSCGRSITFIVNAKTGRAMPFDEVRYDETKMLEDRPGHRRQAMRVDLAFNHFGSCPDSQRFRQGSLL